MRRPGWPEWQGTTLAQKSWLLHAARGIFQSDSTYACAHSNNIGYLRSLLFYNKFHLFSVAAGDVNSIPTDTHENCVCPTPCRVIDAKVSGELRSLLNEDRYCSSPPPFFRVRCKRYIFQRTTLPERKIDYFHSYVSNFSTDKPCNTCHYVA